jgi:hypothetical protein
MVLPLLLVHDAGDVWLIWLVAFLYGISFVMLPAALNGVLKDLLPEELLVDANSSLATTREAFRLGGAAHRRAPLHLGRRLGRRRGRRGHVPRRCGVRGHDPRDRGADATREERFRDEVLAGVRYLRTDRVLKLVLVGFAAAILVIGFSESADLRPARRLRQAGHLGQRLRDRAWASARSPAACPRPV